MVWDLEEAGKPIRMGEEPLPLDLGPVSALAGEGAELVVADRRKLVRLDVSDPYAPVVTEELEGIVAGEVAGLVVRDGVAVVVDRRARTDRVETLSVEGWEAVGAWEPAAGGYIADIQRVRDTTWVLGALAGQPGRLGLAPGRGDERLTEISEQQRGALLRISRTA